MKKLFPLKIPGKVDQRVVEAVKGDVRKYVKRERRKTLPEGFSQWNFNCALGLTRESATRCELADLGRKIDEAAGSGAAEIYVEILAVPSHRMPPAAPAPAAPLPPTSP